MDPSLAVCVTGATGFVGSHVVAELLAHGYRVRGTVRDRSRALDGFLPGLDGATERLELVEADLLDASSIRSAVSGCGGVLHVASPYVLTVEDPQRDLVDPAVRGTTNVLEAARHDGVDRVVVTSSMAAMYDTPPQHPLTEDDWNRRSSLTRNPYAYSKTLAERAVWEYADRNPGFGVVAINPGVVIGPSYTPALNTSARILTALADGSFPALVSLWWAFVDVRDVAAAHRLALETPDATGRYLCAADALSLRELVDVIEASDLELGRLPSLPADNRVGTWLARLLARFQPRGTRTFLTANLGRRLRFDNSKICRDLGIEFRPIEASIVDAVTDLIRWGHL